MEPTTINDPTSLPLAKNDTVNISCQCKTVNFEKNNVLDSEVVMVIPISDVLAEIYLELFCFLSFYLNWHAELMLLGFISLLLTVGTKPITKICIPAKAAGFMLPCKKKNYNEDEEDHDKDPKRKLLSLAQEMMWRRSLAADAATEDYCGKNVSNSSAYFIQIFQLDRVIL